MQRDRAGETIRNRHATEAARQFSFFFLCLYVSHVTSPIYVQIIHIPECACVVERRRAVSYAGTSRACTCCH